MWLLLVSNGFFVETHVKLCVFSLRAITFAHTTFIHQPTTDTSCTPPSIMSTPEKTTQRPHIFGKPGKAGKAGKAKKKTKDLKSTSNTSGAGRELPKKFPVEVASVSELVDLVNAGKLLCGFARYPRDPSAPPVTVAAFEHAHTASMDGSLLPGVTSVPGRSGNMRNGPTILHTAALAEALAEIDAASRGPHTVTSNDPAPPGVVHKRPFNLVTERCAVGKGGRTFLGVYPIPAGCHDWTEFKLIPTPENACAYVLPPVGPGDNPYVFVYGTDGMGMRHPHGIPLGGSKSCQANQYHSEKGGNVMIVVLLNNDKEHVTAYMQADPGFVNMNFNLGIRQGHFDNNKYVGCHDPRLLDKSARGLAMDLLNFVTTASGSIPITYPGKPVSSPAGLSGMGLASNKKKIYPRGYTLPVGTIALMDMRLAPQFQFPTKMIEFVNEHGLKFRTDFGPMSHTHPLAFAAYFPSLLVSNQEATHADSAYDASGDGNGNDIDDSDNDDDIDSDMVVMDDEINETTTERQIETPSLGYSLMSSPKSGTEIVTVEISSDEEDEEERDTDDDCFDDDDDVIIFKPSRF
jgi:hypothetical protein